MTLIYRNTFNVINLNQKSTLFKKLDPKNELQNPKND